MRNLRTLLGALLFAASVSAGPPAAVGNWAAPPYWTPPSRARAAVAGTRAAPAAPSAPQTLPSPPLPFVAIAPCRLADTRGYGFTGPYGPPSIAPLEERVFDVAGQCGIPAGAQAVSFNFTAVLTTGPGDLRLYPKGAARPLVSTLNYLGGQVVANAAIVPLGGSPAGIVVSPDGSATDLVIDVNGYYAPVLGAVRTVWVSPVGTAAENGAALQSALAGITTASAAQPWLLKIEPGAYDVGTTPLQMKPWVDVEGSGEGVTTITGTVSGGAPSSGTVWGIAHAELRFLTVENTGPDVHVGVYNAANAFRLTHVTARATGSTYPIGVYNSADALLTNVTITSDWTAFYTIFGSPTLDAVTAIAPTAVMNDRGNLAVRGCALLGSSVGIHASTDSGESTGYSVRVDHSRVTGAASTIVSESVPSSTMSVYVGATQLDGGPVSGTGLVRCVGAYSGSYTSPGMGVCP